MALQKKIPVVTIMGHVDHGKTSLLDYIRKTKVAASEAGEITQAIGAYQAEIKNQKITFIDTPGHEAFIQMRRRGALVSDIVVLVVAANDGVMPQTKESIKIIKEAGVSFLVAVNKIDLPGASLEKVKTQLAENEVYVEGYGGEIVIVPVSAKTGEGVDYLLEMILLTAEMAEIKADPESLLKAIVIESKFDKNCGPTATVIVQEGQIKKGSMIWAGNICCKTRMMLDYLGKSKETAFPGDPVLIMGFEKLPETGTIITSCFQNEEIKQPDEKIKEDEKPKIKIILKADVFGSLEAILNCLPQEVLVMDKSVGEINQSDVMLAKTLEAEIHSFNLKISPTIEKLAQAEKVKIRAYTIIYDLIQNLEKRVLKLLSPEIDRKIVGKAEILQVFEMKGQKIAGCLVKEGKINKGLPVCLKRGEEILADTKIISLKEQKQDINEAGAGSEFGAVFAKIIDFLPGDMVLSYSLEEN